MFTTETLNQCWKEMSEFEREHFGLKYGDDFGLVAQALRANDHFMQVGGIALMLASLDMMSVKDRMEKSPDKESAAKEVLNRPNNLHNIMAEIFYLGYRIGKKEGETSQLENLARGEQP